MKAQTLTVRLGHDRVDRANERESLQEVLQKAIGIIFPGAAERGEHYERRLPTARRVASRH